MKLAISVKLAFLTAFLTRSALAYCPSYTPEETAGGQNCGIEPALGTNPTATEWNGIFAEVSGGQASWKTDGPTIGTLTSGCASPLPRMEIPAHFPCHVLKAIAMNESGWKQFCAPDTPAASAGSASRTLISFDCGYGVGQVTSGMHKGDKPGFDPNRVAKEPVYNLATGTLILAQKWESGQCVGDQNPDLVEDWYSAIWAYNGLAYSNNPNNPNLDPGRGVYDPKNGGSYTYQEHVFGYMEHPPSPDDWNVLAPAYPNRADVGTSGVPPKMPDPKCASPTDCTKTRTVHTSSCGAALDGGISDATPSAVDASPANSGHTTGIQEDGGCSCRLATKSPTSRSGLVFAGFGVLLLVLRRRHS